MADKTVLIELSVEGKNALSKVNELTNSLKTLEKGTDEYKQAVKELAEQERILTKAQKARDKAQKESSKQMKQVKTDTGAATSATLELGRVFSDMPYGIRGVANNLQQLAANLFFMSKKTNGVTGKMQGFKGAIGSLLKNLIGPAGLLVAFQAIVAAFDYFSTSSEKVEKKTDATTESIKKLTEELNKLMSVYEVINPLDNEISFDGLLNVDTINIKELIKILDKDIKGFSDAFNKLSKEEQNFEGIQSLIKKRTELITLKKAEVQLQKEVLDLQKTYNEKVIGRASIDSIKESKKILNETQENLLFVKKGIIEIEDLFTKSQKIKKNKKISPFKTPKELDLDVKNNEAALLAFAKKTELQLLKNKESEELNAAKTEEQRSIIKQRYAKLALIAQIKNERKVLLLKKATEKAILQGKYDTFQKEAELRRLAYIDTINKSELSEKQKSSAIKKATADTLKITSAAFKEQQAELGSDGTFETRWKAILAAFNTLTEARLKFTNVGKLDKDTFETDLEKMAAYAEAARAIIGGITDFVNGEFDRQLIIEENKTNALNNELNKRLLNENLSKEARENIQNQIAQNDERLRVKQEKIERKRFKMQKAANIALAMVDTFRAGVGVMADTRGGSIARIAGMTAVIASGLLSVATIARQKFQSSAGSSPLAGGVSSTGGGRAEPSFNIVGRSNDNLLLNAIQSQFDQPLRAYVVARDVTNQQQMDGIITDAAGT